MYACAMQYPDLDLPTHVLLYMFSHGDKGTHIKGGAMYENKNIVLTAADLDVHAHHDISYEVLTNSTV